MWFRIIGRSRTCKNLFLVHSLTGFANIRDEPYIGACLLLILYIRRGVLFAICFEFQDFALEFPFSVIIRNDFAASII